MASLFWHYLIGMAEKRQIQHIGIIMDGNRRWAKERDLPPLEGHKQGYEVFKHVSDWCLETGIHILTVFAFSTENWNRPPEEVDYLMALLHDALLKEVETFTEKGVRLKVIGRRDRLTPELSRLIEEIEHTTKDNTEALLHIAIDYGGREEIVDAVKKLVDSGVSSENISHETVMQNLYTAGTPDPDVIVRTSGEKRLSGFLLWQSSYSELFFLDKYWPDFTREDFDRIIEEYAERERRFGK